MDVKPSPTHLSDQHGATGWILRHGKTLADVDGSVAKAIKQGEIEAIGTDSDGIGVPLKSDDKMIGVLIVQSNKPDNKYTLEDIEILNFIAKHISTALTRARAIEETRKRSNITLNDGVTYQIVVAKDGANNAIRFYVNGAYVSFLNYTNEPTGGSSLLTMIGATILAPIHIGEVALFDGVQLRDEVMPLYQSFLYGGYGAGIQGVQGLDGLYAAQGIQGLQGVQGTTVPQGIQGVQGVQGTQGLQGVQGLIG